MKYEVCINSYRRFLDGKGIGEWVELGRDWDEIAEELTEKGFDLDGYDEEIFISDDNGLGCGEDSPYYVNNVLERIKEDDEILFLACTELIDFEEVHDLFTTYNSEDVIFYEAMDLLEVAYEIADEFLDKNNSPDLMSRYFDYRKFANDLKIDGFVETKYGVILLP